MISITVNSSDTIRDWDVKTLNPNSKHTIKDIRSSIKILGFLCLLIAFIFLLFARFIIINQYPETTYIQFGLQLSPTAFTTSNIGTSGLDDTTNRASTVLHPSINMRYTLYDIDKRHPESLVIQSIIYYSTVCNILYLIQSHRHRRL